VQRVLNSGVKFAAGSDMCWAYPGKTRGDASALTLLGWQDRIGTTISQRARGNSRQRA
jgi:hypothetical protein